MSRYGTDWLMFPSVLGIGAVILIAVAAGILPGIIRRRRARTAGDKTRRGE